jgi:hypothetical protein
MNTAVPPAPKPVIARAIAVAVKLPNPSTLSTRINDISRASRPAERKKRERECIFSVLFNPALEVTPPIPW